MGDDSAAAVGALARGSAIKITKFKDENSQSIRHQEQDDIPIDTHVRRRRRSVAILTWNERGIPISVITEKKIEGGGNTYPAIALTWERYLSICLSVPSVEKVIVPRALLVPKVRMMTGV